jgi:hypothetical protein
MTDRIKGFTVILEKDYRIDDIETIQKAIAMIKGVVGVQPVISQPSDFLAEQRVKNKIREDLYEFITQKL